jgi:hypothetical protein
MEPIFYSNHDSEINTDNNPIQVFDINSLMKCNGNITKIKREQLQEIARSMGIDTRDIRGIIKKKLQLYNEIIEINGN